MSHRDPRGAAQSIHAMLALIHSLDNAPVTSSLFGRNHYEKLACNTIASLLPLGVIPVEDLKRINSNLPSVNRIETLHRVLLGMQSMIIDTIQDCYKPSFFFVTWLCRTEGRADCIRYLRFIEQIDECLNRPWPESARTIQEHTDRLRTSCGQSPYYGIFYPFTSSISSEFVIWPARQLETEAWVRITRILIAAEQYRQVNNELPKNVASLVPKYLTEVPKDPFTQNALQAVRDGKNCILVYSVGPNCVDDKGQNDDIAIRLDYNTAETILKKKRANNN
jgi:hypothetical protein